MCDSSLPRGLRNCNPLNIRRSADLWQGLHEQQSDPDFYCFKSMAWGYRAAFIVLRTYNHKYGINTISGIIQRWAPEADDNDTEEYIQRVCVLTGFARDMPLNPYDPTHMGPLVAAISRVECGRRANLTEVKAGWELYMGSE